MSQYPNEKAPHQDWVNPPDFAYASRDGAPAASSRSDWVNPPDFSYASRDGAPASSSRADWASPPDFSGAPASYPPPPDYGTVTGEKHPETVLAPPPNPYPEAGPSAPQEEQVSLGSFFGPKGNPESWNRPPPPQLPYSAFPPMRLLSNASELSKGFPELPPPCGLNPHPFATHDVTEADWKRFLADVKKAGSLSPQQRIKSNVIPLVTGMSLITGFLATIAIEKRMKYRNRGAAGDLVDHWNHYFFGPRRMEVALSQGSQSLNNKVEGSEDSSSEEEYGRHGGLGDRHERKAERRARRDARRAAKRAAKAERKEWKASGDSKHPYELVITSI